MTGPHPIRIALVVPALAGGGGVPAVARFIKDTAQRCNRFQLTLVSLAMSADDAASTRLSRPATWIRGATATAGVWEDLPFVHVGAVCGEFEFQRYRPRELLRKALAPCSLIQVVCGSPAFANAVLDQDKPVALQVATRARVERRQRESRPRGFAGWWRKAMTEITDVMDDAALVRADAIQVENAWMLDYARALNVDRDVDLRYAPPGIDVTLFRPRQDRTPDGDAYVLCVGRLSDPRKNIGLLLEAYALLSTELREHVRLVLAGSCGPPPSFWARADALGVRRSVSYVAHPDRDALISLYQGAAIFALPSDEEGLGVVLLEAMACGIPAVSTRSGGPDGIVADGRDGYLVERGDVEAMASRMERLLVDMALNIEMGRKARRTVAMNYDERIAGDVFIDMWDRMAHRARYLPCVA